MMHILFRIPGINHDIPAYGVMMMLGFFAAIIWATRRAERSQADPDVILNCGFIALIAGVVGARFMFVIRRWDQLAIGGVGDGIVAALQVWKGGLEFYGGFIAATVVTVAYLVLWRHSLRWYLDIITPSAMIGLCLGRVGCFLNGCCWGGVCTLPWAVTFPYASPPAQQHWYHDQQPDAALPAELIFELPKGETLLTSTHPIAYTVNRDSLMVSQADLDQASAAEDAAREQYEAAKAKAAAAAVENAAAAQAALNQAQRAYASAQLRYRDIRAQLKKYNLSLDEFKALAAEHRSLPVHPTQLYAAIAALLLAIMLDRLYWRRTRDGVVIATMLIAQPLARYMLEIIRTDNPVDTFGGHTVSQGIALGLSAAGVVLLLIVYRLPPRSPRAKIFIPPEEATAPAKTAST
jgi:phosphatidylglycerol:prolipoprotein diacylglycerol transferase